MSSYEAPANNDVDKNPPKEKYHKLGPGGRIGPKDHVNKTNYAEAKVTEPYDKPPVMKESIPPSGSDTDDDFGSGVIV